MGKTNIPDPFEKSLRNFAKLTEHRKKQALQNSTLSTDTAHDKISACFAIFWHEANSLHTWLVNQNHTAIYLAHANKAMQELQLLQPENLVHANIIQLPYSKNKNDKAYLILIRNGLTVEDHSDEYFKQVQHSILHKKISEKFNLNQNMIYFRFSKKINMVMVFQNREIDLQTAATHLKSVLAKQIDLQYAEQACVKPAVVATITTPPKTPSNVLRVINQHQPFLEKPVEIAAKQPTPDTIIQTLMYRVIKTKRHLADRLKKATEKLGKAKMAEAQNCFLSADEAYLRAYSHAQKARLRLDKAHVALYQWKKKADDMRHPLSAAYLQKSYIELEHTHKIVQTLFSETSSHVTNFSKKLYRQKSWHDMMLLLLQQEGRRLSPDIIKLVNTTRANRLHVTDAFVKYVKQIGDEGKQAALVNSVLEKRNALGVALHTPRSDFRFAFTLRSYENKKITGCVGRIVKTFSDILEKGVGFRKVT